MKLRRLELLRYGHLTDAVLDFPDHALLHVVHGANEAGKSTALAAIADALFGFGHRTDFDFLHGAQQLRIGFTLAASDGSEASFIRRKGRRDTLRDPDDQVVADESLRRFLGGAGRDLFEREFGLDGARLRHGGQELLRLGGEAGESLLAGSGLFNLRAVLARIEEEAKSLVGDGRGRRALSDAAEAWRKAQRESEERAIPPRAWQDAEAARDAAVAALNDAQQRLRALAGENNRLQRVRRVTPVLRQLTDARERLAELADAPHLPPDAEPRFHGLLTASREAARDLQRETAETQRLTAAHAALPQDAAVLAVQDAIDTLAARQPVVLQAGADQPQVQANVAALRARVMEAIAELGLDLAPETARDALPPATARRAVTRLIQRHAALTADAKTATRGLETARRKREQAEQALQGSAPPPSPALLRRTIDAVRAEGPLDTELTRAQRTLAEASAATAAALASLPLWQGDIAGLIACPLTLPADADAAAARLEAAAKQRAEAQADCDRLADENAALEEKLAELACGETVPTPDAVAAARAARDRMWRLLRRMLEGGPPPSADEIGALPAGPMPDAFEALRDEADRLADRRADDAQRVADYLTATARMALVRARRQQAADDLAAGDAALQDAEAAWRALWAPAGVIPGTPAAMVDWRRARNEVLRLATEQAAASGKCDDLAARRTRAQAELAALLPDLPAQPTLNALLQRAATACDAAEKAEAEHRTREKALADATEQMAEQQQAADAAGAALLAWDQAWAPAVAALRLPPETSIDAAEAALAAWQRIAEAVPAWRDGEERIAAMSASIDAFTAELQAVQTRLGETDTGEPPPIVAARLIRRLAEARKAATEAERLAKEIAAHEAAAAEATRRHDAAELELAALRSAAGAEDDAALEQAIDRARRRDAAAADAAAREQALVAQGDGMAEDALRAEVAAVEPDAVVARIAGIEAEQAELGERQKQLSAERANAERTLADMQDGHDAASKAQEAANALADARAAAERFARLRVATVLLRAGIDRFRKEQQGPLLRSAGAHFSLLTGGRYDRLVVDYNDSNRAVLLAIARDSGTECPVEALSEGARDQLYLALRIAAVRAHAARTEPLPFIADDLLVHFDDTRAAAAIALLAELGRSTQTILFTHHDHIAALAERQEGVVVQRMVPAAAGAVAA